MEIFCSQHTMFFIFYFFIIFKKNNFCFSLTQTSTFFHTITWAQKCWAWLMILTFFTPGLDLRSIFLSFKTNHHPSGLTVSSHFEPCFSPWFRLPFMTDWLLSFHLSFHPLKSFTLLYTFLPTPFARGFQTFFQMNTLSTCGVMSLAVISIYCLLVDHHNKLPVAAQRDVP